MHETKHTTLQLCTDKTTQISKNNTYSIFVKPDKVFGTVGIRAESVNTEVDGVQCRVHLIYDSGSDTDLCALPDAVHSEILNSNAIKRHTTLGLSTAHGSAAPVDTTLHQVSINTCNGKYIVPNVSKVTLPEAFVPETLLKLNINDGGSLLADSAPPANSARLLLHEGHSAALFPTPLHPSQVPRTLLQQYPYASYSRSAISGGIILSGCLSKTEPSGYFVTSGKDQDDYDHSNSNSNSNGRSNSIGNSKGMKYTHSNSISNSKSNTEQGNSQPHKRQREDVDMITAVKRLKTLSYTTSVSDFGSRGKIVENTHPHRHDTLKTDTQTDRQTNRQTNRHESPTQYTPKTILKTSIERRGDQHLDITSHKDRQRHRQPDRQPDNQTNEDKETQDTNEDKETQDMAHIVHHLKFGWCKNLHLRQLAYDKVMREFQNTNSLTHQIPIGQIGCVACDSQSLALLQRHTLSSMAFSKQLLFYQTNIKGFWMIERFIHHKFSHVRQDWRQLAARELSFLRKLQQKPETLKEITYRQLSRFNNMEICLARDLRISPEMMLKSVIIPRHLVVSQSRSSPARLTLAANVSVNMESSPSCTNTIQESTGCSNENADFVRFSTRDLKPRIHKGSQIIPKDPKNKKLKKSFYCSTLDSHIDNTIEYNQLLLQDSSKPNEIPRIWLLQDCHSIIIFTDIKSFFTSLYLTPHTAIHQAELFYVDKNFQPTFEYSKIDTSKGFQVALPVQASFGTVDLPRLAEIALNQCLDKYILQLEKITELDELCINMSKRYLQANYIDDGTIMINNNDINIFNKVKPTVTSGDYLPKGPIIHTMAVTICSFITNFLAYSNFHLKGFECEDEVLCKKLNNLPLLAHKVKPCHPWQQNCDETYPKGSLIFPRNEPQGSLGIKHKSEDPGFKCALLNGSPCTTNTIDTMTRLKSATWKDILKIEYQFPLPIRPKAEQVHREWLLGPNEMKNCDLISADQTTQENTTIRCQESTLLIPDVRLSKVDPSGPNLELLPYIFNKFTPKSASKPFGKSLGRNFHYPNCTSLGVSNLTIKIGPKQQNQITLNSYEDFTKLCEKPISRRTLLSLLSQCYDVSNLLCLGPRVFCKLSLAAMIREPNEN